MAYSTIDKSSLFMNTLLWTGDGGASRSITGVGFQPDMVWIKQRDGTNNHMLADSARGANNKINPNTTSANDTNTTSLTAFGADGFTAGTNTEINASGSTYVGWNWKAGTTSGLSGGTITPSAYSINTTSKFGIYKYTGNGSAGATIAHGLGATPSLVIVKRLTNTYDWAVQTPYTHATDPNEYILRLNTDNAGTQDDAFNNTLASSTVVTLGASTYTNATSADQEYVMYAWAPVTGFSAVGKYKGTGNSEGPFVYIGFKPSFILIKRYDSTSDWMIVDNKRLGYNQANYRFKANDNVAEDTGTYVNLVSTGFKIVTTSGDWNTDGGYYDYIAFGQPIVGSNGVVATGR